MLFYFSGTGNSNWVADTIALMTGDRAVDLATLLRERTFSFEREQTVGFVFPVFAWQAPEIVVDFVRSVSIAPDAHTFAVCTCADEAGYTLELLAKEIRLDSGYTLIMPNNYVLGSGANSESVIRDRIDAAKQKVPQICENILAKKHIFETIHGQDPEINSGVNNENFKKGAKDTALFRVEDRCTGCGLCEAVCPTRTIQLADGRPTWHNDCTRCLSCINRCPETAIEFGDRTVEKTRYYFKKA